jgi:hypothetical protein
MSSPLLPYGLIVFGGLITILFWIPKVVNRPLLKELLGRRFRLVYLFYFSNGPFLLFIGLYLLWYARR